MYLVSSLCTDEALTELTKHLIKMKELLADMVKPEKNAFQEDLDEMSYMLRERKQTLVECENLCTSNYMVSCDYRASDFHRAGCLHNVQDAVCVPNRATMPFLDNLVINFDKFRHMHEQLTTLLQHSPLKNKFEIQALCSKIIQLAETKLTMETLVEMRAFSEELSQKIGIEMIYGCETDNTRLLCDFIGTTHDLMRGFRNVPVDLFLPLLSGCCFREHQIVIANEGEKCKLEAKTDLTQICQKNTDLCEANTEGAKKLIQTLKLAGLTLPEIALIGNNYRDYL